MKYALITFFSLAIGFFAGYLFYDSTVDPLTGRPPATVRTIVEPLKAVSMQQAPDDIDVDLDYIREKQTVFDKLLAAWQIAAIASPTELERLLEETITINDPLYDSNIAGILLERWTAFDPEGALNFVTAHPQMNQEYFQAHVLTSWARNDPRMALAHFEDMNDPQIKFAVGARLLSDPTPGAQFLAEIERILGPGASKMASNVRMRRLPPDEAFEQALGFSSRERISSLMQTVSRWVHADPDAAVAEIMNLPNQQERDIVLQTALSQLARTDPDHALQLQALYAPDNQNLERSILTGFATADPVRALARVEQYTGRTADLNPLSNLLGAWVQVDPPAALAYAATLPGDYDWTVYQVMASRYAAAYPDEAVDWVLALPDDMIGIKRIAINAVTQRNPALAEQIVDRVRDPGLRLQIVQQVASEKAAQGLQAAVNWINRTTSADSELRITALASAAMGASITQPEEAAALVNRLPDGAIRNNAANVVAMNWSRAQPDRTEEIYSLLEIEQAQEEDEWARRAAEARKNVMMVPSR